MTTSPHNLLTPEQYDFSSILGTGLDRSGILSGVRVLFKVPPELICLEWPCGIDAGRTL
jgi:hypothetical protein